MKQGIHPKYEKAVITCACGNTFETRSTKGNMQIDICNLCHPFYTGKQKIVDTAGRVEKFNKQLFHHSETPVSPLWQSGVFVLSYIKKGILR